ncbi:unnamed protein product [Toxocara canis]|uniref:Reverse transcriptase domain-containing protein n=1 Tax=Toxocara canis TaxID=6265 RepID=A0A183U8T5_TOXCA|nr:unnamed protein product [Toxocara canis]
MLLYKAVLASNPKDPRRAAIIPTVSRTIRSNRNDDLEERKEFLTVVKYIDVAIEEMAKTKIMNVHLGKEGLTSEWYQPQEITRQGSRRRFTPGSQLHTSRIRRLCKTCYVGGEVTRVKKLGYFTVFKDHKNL